MIGSDIYYLTMRDHWSWHGYPFGQVRPQPDLGFISNFSGCTKGAISHLNYELMTSARGEDPSRVQRASQLDIFGYTSVTEHSKVCLPLSGLGR